MIDHNKFLRIDVHENVVIRKIWKSTHMDNEMFQQ